MSVPRAAAAGSSDPRAGSASGRLQRGALAGGVAPWASQFQPLVLMWP